MHAPKPPQPPQDLPRALNLGDSAALVVGNVIGSGIFIVPAAIAQTLPDTWMILSVWVFAGVVSLFGALAYAELSAMMPATGGQYVHMRESFGGFWAFLFGWALFLVIRSGGTATLAVGFAIYLGYLIPMAPWLAKAASVALIAALTAANYIGIRTGARVQNFFTFLKVLGLVLLIGCATLSREPSKLDFSGGFAGMSLDSFGVALIACLWAYQGWFSISWVAGEVRNPGRNIPLSLIFGVGAVITLYLAANLSYMHVLTVGEIAGTERVAATVAEQVLGPSGAIFVTVTILVSIIGATNSGILSAPRVYFAQARDGLFFRKFGEVHPTYQTPGFSILMQGTWASLLALSGSYEKLFSYVIFTSWLFYGLTVAGVFVLRRKYPDLPRPYRMWGYPVTPALFTLIAFGFVLNTVISKPEPSLAGLGLVATGIPAYLFWKRRPSHFKGEDTTP